jgi:hypothetical protein
MLAFLLFITGCGVSSAADIVSGEIVEYGYYEKKGEFERHQNIATTSGYVQEGKNVELVEQTDRIPLARNRLFGFKFRITGFDDKNAVQLKLVVTHPEITRDNGSKSSGYSYPVLLDVNNGVIENRSGYSIDHDYEMVEGEWAFELWYYNQKLVSQTFHTVAADDTNTAPENNEQESAPLQDSQENQQPVAGNKG